MNTKHLYCAVLILVLAAISTSTWAQGKLSMMDKMGVSQESSVQRLMNRYTEDCEDAEDRGFPGYRVQVMSVSGQGAKDVVMARRAEILKKFDQYPVYVLYKTPNFKLQIGDCRSKSEALKVLNTIKDSYPNAFVVATNIQYPN